MIWAIETGVRDVYAGGSEILCDTGRGSSAKDAFVFPGLSGSGVGARKVMLLRTARKAAKDATPATKAKSGRYGGVSHSCAWDVEGAGAGAKPKGCCTERMNIAVLRRVRRCASGSRGQTCIYSWRAHR